MPTSLTSAASSSGDTPGSGQINSEGERQAYFTDEEYAAALLGTDLDHITRQVGSSGPDD